MAGISILMYHQVGKFPPMRNHRASYCDIGRFRLQMLALKALGLKVVSMTEAARMLRGEARMPDRAVVLTFDDGCRNFRDHALPVLEAHGFPATVYAVAGMIGGTADWLVDAALPPAPLMTWSELRDIRNRGVEIGSHSLDHLRLGTLEPAEQRRQIQASKHILEQELGVPVPHMCYPYGSLTIDTLRATAEAGYETGVTCQRGAATPAFDMLGLPRKAISYGDTTPGFLWKLYMKDQRKGETIRREDKVT